MTSLSTKFLGQPRLMKPIFMELRNAAKPSVRAAGKPSGRRDALRPRILRRRLGSFYYDRSRLGARPSNAPADPPATAMERSALGASRPAIQSGRVPLRCRTCRDLAMPG